MTNIDSLFYANDKTEILEILDEYLIAYLMSNELDKQFDVEAWAEQERPTEQEIIARADYIDLCSKIRNKAIDRIIKKIEES